MTDIRRSLNSNQIADIRRAGNLASFLQFNYPNVSDDQLRKKKKNLPGTLILRLLKAVPTQGPFVSR